MKKILLGILALTTLLGVAFATPSPVSAADNKETCTCYDDQGNKTEGTKVPTSILGDSVCDCGHGESILGILKLIVDIMTIGIGILGIVGISITGIQYLTAGGNEEQTRKAKRRLFEIVIGLAAYVLIYAILSWLLPGFSS